jgi:DNA recombination-dependent growth factor C
MPVDANEQFDGDFTLMCAELNQLLAALLEALEEKVVAAKAA